MTQSDDHRTRAIAQPSPPFYSLRVAALVVLTAVLIAIAAAHPAGLALCAIVVAATLWILTPAPDSWRVLVYLLLFYLLVSTLVTLVLGAAAGEVSRSVVWSALWREALIFLLATAAVLAFAIRASRRFTLADTLALALAGLVLLYTALGLGSRGGELGILQRALGARAWLIPIALYFVGRMTPASPLAGIRDLAVVKRLVGLVTAFAFVEFFLLGDAFWQALDYESYLQQIGTPESGIFRGVTLNYYWVDQAGGLHRRWPAFMGTLSLGFWYIGALSILGAAAIAYRSSRIGLLLIFAAIALVGSRTRAAMGGLLVALPLLFLISRRMKRTMVVALGAIVVALAALNANPDVLPVLAQRLRVPVDPSALGHIAAIIHGTGAVLATPLGFGVGTAGFVGSGFAGPDTQAIGESLYLSLAAELGWLGALLFLGWVVVAASRLGRFGFAADVPDHRWVLATGLCVATVGYLIASVTTEVWRGLQAGALYWWLLGATMRTIDEDSDVRWREANSPR